MSYSKPLIRSSAPMIVMALRDLKLSQKLLVIGSPLIFLFTVLVQNFYMRYLDRMTRKVHTEDDNKISLSLKNNFLHVTRIVIPTWRCKEVVGFALFVLLFGARAYLRVLMSKSNGLVLNSILSGVHGHRLAKLLRSISVRTAYGMSLAVCTGSIEGLRYWLIASIRERLSASLQRRFYQRLVFYQATVLDNRLDAADTTISSFSAEFAEHMAELPYYFLMPGIECLISTYVLFQHTGLRGTSAMLITATCSVFVLRLLAPQFGRIHTNILSREDNYRRMLTSSLINVETIAMYNSAQYTRSRLDTALSQLTRALHVMAAARTNYDTLESVFETFLSIAASIVVFDSTRRTYFSRPVGDVYMEMSIINDLIASIKLFVLNFRELSHLTEYTNKIMDFDVTLSSIASGTFVHDSAGHVHSGNTPSIASPITYTNIKYIDDNPMLTHTKTCGFDIVVMQNVTLRSPAGQILLKDLNLTLRADADYVITGDNGTGKTSILRMLARLWLPSEGTLTINRCVRLLFAPQHSYMVPQCTLYEQIAFPQQTTSATHEIRERLRKAIELSGAQTVVEVIGGYDSDFTGLDPANLDSTYDWSSLSGGQKQRISMARIFFYVLGLDRTGVLPLAVLDEATSMMDDTEQDVINNLRRMNIRMISVTHRDVVIRHHDQRLCISKNGAWSLQPVTNKVAVGSLVQSSDVQ